MSFAARFVESETEYVVHKGGFALNSKATANGGQVATSRTTLLLTAMLVASVGLNVSLAYKMRAFTNAQDAQLAKLEARRLKAGAIVPPLTASRVGADGNATPEMIAYAGTDRPTVLYVLSPSCGWCLKNENSIRKLIAEKGSDYRFFAVTLVEEGLAEYQKTHNLGAPLYAGISQKARDAYRMGGTPQTIVVSPDGVVIANWNGAYTGRQKDAIEDFFKVDLPDIKLSKPPSS